MLDLDTLLGEPLEIKIKGKVYKITDPGITNMLKVVKCYDDIQKGKGNMPEFSEALFGITEGIPQEIFDRLSLKQLVGVYNEIGKHFMSSGEVEEKDPLSEKSSASV